MPTGEPIICRRFLLPSSLIAYFDSALAALCSDTQWVIGPDPFSVSVEEVTHAFKQYLDTQYTQGCRMVGEIIEIATDVVPDGCLPCDGSVYLLADYPDLAAVIHVGYVINATQFRTPDRVTRFGMGGQVVGSQGGEQTHTLTETEIPAHVHSEQDPGIVQVQPGTGAFPLTDPGLPGETGSTGGGAAHNNMPPWEGSQFVIVAVTNGP